MIKIALEKLRAEFPNKYVGIKQNNDQRYVVINDFFKKMNDTIVAIATAHGVGSISIIRLSGERALEIALKLSKKMNFAPAMQLLQSFLIKKMNSLMKP